MAATPPIRPRPSNRSYATVEFSTAASGLSDSVNLTGLKLSSLTVTSNWTAAVIGFQVDTDNSGNYYNLYDKDGNLYYFTVGASRTVVVDPAIFSGAQNLRLISETTGGVATAQAAVRTIRLGLSEG